MTYPPQTKLLIIAHNLSPERNVGAVRVRKFIKFLPEQGVEPIVITSNDQHGLDSSIKVRVVSSLSMSSPAFYGSDLNPSSLLRRAVRYLKTILKDLLFSPDKEIWWSLKTIPTAIRLIKSERIDVAFASGSPFSQFITLLILKTLCKTPIIIDFRDPWSSHLTTAKQSFIRKLSINFWESKATKRADGIVAVNKLIIYELAKYKPKGITKVITNGYDPDDFPAQAHIIERKEPFKFLYTGKYSIYREDYNPTTLFEGFKLFQQTHSAPCELIFVGPTDKETIKYSKDFAEYNIHCFEAMDRCKVCEMQQTADILIHFHYPHNYTNAVSLKIYEYIFSRGPILSFNVKEGLLYDFLKEHNLGVTASSQNVEEIAEYFKLAYEGLLIEDVKEVVPSFERFNYSNLTKELAELIKSTVRRL
jgi:glycosyltransferase involved in cell wall biosynthesis